MEILDQTSFISDDDLLLNFSLDDEDDDDKTKLSSSSLDSSIPHLQLNPSPSFPEYYEEEELEWIVNKEAFPAVETGLGLLQENPCHVSVMLDHKSPVSVLDSCSGSFQIPARCPGRARSKRKRKQNEGPQWGNQLLSAKNDPPAAAMTVQRLAPGSLGRRCQHCLAEKTPQWRAGPMGPKTLCNACGVRYKSGRLVPEYRPASSPTFSINMHSNSHRKIMEMRKKTTPTTPTGEVKNPATFPMAKKTCLG